MRTIRCSCTGDCHAWLEAFRTAFNAMMNRGRMLYTSCFNHSTSFSSAFPRCEILFFSALGISAYVWPSYSKHASQPVQVSFVESSPVYRRFTYRNLLGRDIRQFYPALSISICTVHAAPVDERDDSPLSAPGTRWAQRPVPRSMQKCTRPARTCPRSLPTVYGIAQLPALVKTTSCAYCQMDGARNAVVNIAYTYGPGSSLKASKQRHVSSTNTGPWT